MHDNGYAIYFYCHFSRFSSVTVKFSDPEVPSIWHHNEIFARSNFTNPVRLAQKLNFCRIRTALSDIGKNPISAVLSHSCRIQTLNFPSNTFSDHVRILLLKGYENQI